MPSENLGQVSGLYIGQNPPQNTSLIWYDSTPAVRLHKVYNTQTQSWEVLNKDAIISITHSEIRTLAQGVGLAQGSWYKITDIGNVLALAITANKIQYCDTNNNIIVDDLVATTIYMISSNNLQIDDINGVWDVTTKKLKFNFASSDMDMNQDDTLFGKKIRGGVMSLVKYKIRSLISSVSGNSITWNRGLFFNFLSSLQSKYDVPGGVVSKQTYDNDISQITTVINNIAGTSGSILQAAKDYTDRKTTDAEIYSKQLPTAPSISGVPLDIAQGDRLDGIVSKVQRWINKFKKADGIGLTQDFAQTPTQQEINNSDTVDSALRKTQFWIHNQSTEIALPNDWEASSTASPIQNLAANDKFITAFSKIQGKLNQLGDISNGFLESKILSDGEPITTLAIDNGYIGYHYYQDFGHGNDAEFSATYKYDGIDIRYREYNDQDQRNYNTSIELKNDKCWFRSEINSFDSVDNILTPYLFEGESLQGTAMVIRNKEENAHMDLLCRRIKFGKEIADLTVMSGLSYTMGERDGFVLNTNNSGSISELFLPSNPIDGTVIKMLSLTNENVRVRKSNQNHIIPGVGYFTLAVGYLYFALFYDNNWSVWRLPYIS